MPATYILTDSSAQFTRHTFPGWNQIQVIPFHIVIDGKMVEDDPGFKVNSIPQSLLSGKSPELIAPSVEEFYETIMALNSVASDIIAIIMSGQLSKAWENLEKAVVLARGKVRLQIVDSQTTGIGLGFLVQQAAELAAKHIPPAEIEYRVRGRIPHIYSQFCLPNLTYLHRTNVMGYPQAIVGEMLSLMPVFSFEEGRLVSIEKVRNPRHLLDYFQEFLDEFSELDYVAFMQSVPPMITESRALKEHSNLLFSKTSFSEHTINPVIATLFGPRAVGIFAIEQPESS
jgi:DegV family protein with EDD domain